MAAKWWILNTSAKHGTFKDVCLRKLTDFAAPLENTVQEAAVHIKASFKKENRNEEILSFCLMGIKSKPFNNRLFKTIDNHYSARHGVNDAQYYLDQGIKTDTTTTLDPNVMCEHKTERLGKSNHYPNELDVRQQATFQPEQPSTQNRNQTHQFKSWPHYLQELQEELHMR